MIVWDFKEGKRNHKKPALCVCRRLALSEAFGVTVSPGLSLQGKELRSTEHGARQDPHVLLGPPSNQWQSSSSSSLKNTSSKSPFPKPSPSAKVEEGRLISRINRPFETLHHPYL